MRNLKFSSAFVFGLGGLCALLVVNAGLSYRNVRQLNEDAGWVVHTHEVMDALDEGHGNLREAEAVQRTYLITGGATVPPAFNKHMDAARKALGRVKTLTADNAQQQARLPDIQKRVDDIGRIWSDTMSVRQRDGFEAARQIVEKGEAEKVLGELKARIREMDDAERVLLLERQVKTERSYFTAVVSGIVTAALGLAAIALFIWLLDRHLLARQQAATAIHEHRQLLQATLASIGDGVITTDTLGRVTFLNDVAQRLTGWKQEEAAGQPLEKIFCIVNEATRKTVENPALRALASGKIVGLSNHTILIAKDGTEWPLDDSAAPIRDEHGVVSGAVLVFRQVAEKKAAENAMRASEERLSLAVEAAGLGVWDWNLRTDEVRWNTYHETIFGYAPGMPRRNYRDFADRIPADDLAQVEAGLRRAQEEKSEYRFEHRVVWPDGSVRWVHAVGKFHYDAAGEAVRSVGVLIDITHRRQLEDHLRQLAANLAEADRRKDEFLATLAHELRNPLAPISNGLQLMRLAGEDREAIEQARTMMDRQLAQLVRLVDDLLDVSRINQGKLELRKEPLLLETVIHSAIETSRPLIEQMHHDLIVTLPAVPVVVDADLTRLAQVFLNLLNNAAKYSEPGGRIWLTAERQGSDVVVSVKDTGIGIAADQLPQLFTMFAQLDHSINRAQGGLGIGLTLVKRLVEMHGGRIEVRSDGRGQGSEFVVRLPVVAEATVPAGAAELGDAKTALRILVVDDNQDGADSLALMLRIMGNETHTAYDGEEAVAATAEFRPAVILLDIGLPKLTGYEVCRLIREQPGGKRLVIIAQTGWGQEEDRRRTHEAGFDYHMVKPVDPKALMIVLAGLQAAKA